MSDLNRRIELEALITEREGMTAGNKYSEALGRGVAFSDVSFADVVDKIRALVDPETTGNDDVFIQHIQAHLSPGQEVVCKICGKSAREIIGSTTVPSYTPEDVSRLVEALRVAELAIQNPSGYWLSQVIDRIEVALAPFKEKS